MQRFPNELAPGSEIDLLLPYVIDLEAEVDRLRRQGSFVEEQARETVKAVKVLCKGAEKSENAASAMAQIETAANDLAKLLADLHERPGYHPAHDQVAPIAIRPLIDQVFRWQQRLEDAPHAAIRLELDTEHVEWFPARLRHIIDILLANALRFATSQGESRVTLSLRRCANGYELRVADNGVGVSAETRLGMLELYHRAAPTRAAGVGVGLAVAKSLIERSGGTLTVESTEGQGTSFLAVLPRYDVHDFLD
jgi:signal transduction histidine kinase